MAIDDISIDTSYDIDVISTTTTFRAVFLPQLKSKSKLD
jgi:hypothetical protein